MGMKFHKIALFISLLSPVLLSPVYAQRGETRGGGGVAPNGFRGGYYGGHGYYYGGRYWWGPGLYFGWGYPYYWGYPYSWPYYWSYPYYGYNPYYDYYGYGPYDGYPPPPPPAPAAPQPQSQGPSTPPQPGGDPPADDPPQLAGRDARPLDFGAGNLLSDPDVRQQLGITADQAAKIRQQESDFWRTEIRNRAELQVKRIELEDLLSADKPNRAAIDRKVEEIGAAQVGLEKSAIDNFLAVWDVLTPAQRQKLRELMAQRRRPVAFR